MTKIIEFFKGLFSGWNTPPPRTSRQEEDGLDYSMVGYILKAETMLKQNINPFKAVVGWLNSTRATVWCMKYLPFIGTLLLTIHCGLLLCGVNLKVLEFFVGFPMSSMLMFFLLSRQFHFCILHKHLIGYVSAMEICMFLQRYDAWGRALTPARWVMMSIGIVLIIWSIVAYILKRGCECPESGS